MGSAFIEKVCYRKKSLFFHYIISVFILFVFLLLRFCDCGSSYAPARGNKTLHGPMLLESRLFCSHVMGSLYFFFNSKLRCTSLEICKNTVRWNTLIYAQLLQLPTNFTIELCFKWHNYPGTTLSGEEKEKKLTRYIPLTAYFSLSAPDS